MSSGSFSQTAGSLTVSGAGSVSGATSFSVSGGTASFASLTVTGGSTKLSISGTGTVKSTSSGISNAGTLSLSSSTATLDGSSGGISNTGFISGYGLVKGTISGSGGTVRAKNGGTLDVQGNVTGQTLAIDLTGTVIGGTLRLDGTDTAAPISLTDTSQTLLISGTGALTINAGQSATAGTITDNGALTVSTGGLTLGSTGTAGTVVMTEAGALTVSAGGLTIQNTGAGSSTLTASSGTASITGGTTLNALGTLALSGATFNTDSANITGGTLTQSGGALAVSGAATISGGTNTISSGTASFGTLTVSGGSTSISITGGTIQSTGSGGVVNGGSIVLGGSGAKLDGSTGGISNSGTITGFGNVAGALSGTGVVLATGGTLDLAGSESGSLAFNIANSAASFMRFDGSIAATNTVTFLGTSGGLILNDLVGNTLQFNATLSGLNIGTSGAKTNYIDVTQATITKATISSGHLILQDSSGTIDSIALSGSYSGAHVNWGADGGGSDVWLSDSVCFAAGTRIRTADGERAVEDLAEGDLVMALVDGELQPRPIKWMGRQRLDLTRHPHLHLAAPIRVRAGALGQSQPHRDLLVSPEHCLFADGRLIPAKRLVNGTTVVQEFDHATIEYFHVELEQHSLLLAEGLLAECYLHTGNRAFFANSGLALVLHPEFTVNAGLKCWETDACAPLASDTEIEPVWHKLAARAAALGYAMPQVETTNDPDLHIVAGSRRIRPLFKDGTRCVFALPAGVTGARLVSRSAVPLQLGSYSPDTRQLGVAIRRITIRDGANSMEMPADHPQLGRGWYPAECNGTSIWRWTDGDAVLPVPTARKPLMVEVHLAMAARYAVEAVPPAAERLAA